MKMVHFSLLSGKRPNQANIPHLPKKRNVEDEILLCNTCNEIVDIFDMQV
jgi:hypothetical protein